MALIERQQESQAEYWRDADNPDDVVKTYYVSADMQKVNMLPHLPGNKTCTFTRRITN